MSGASWPAAAWKPREAKEGAACRESVSWADGAKRVRRCFPTQKAGLPLPSDHSLRASAVARTNARVHTVRVKKGVTKVVFAHKY